MTLAALLLLSICSSAKMLIPGGHTIGMKAYAVGLVVTAVEEGSPAQKAGLRQGDILRQVEGEPLNSAGQLTDRMTDGKLLQLEFDRGEETYAVTVEPKKTENEYRLGAYVRDNIAGIGTVSYYDPEDGSFGALGHGISDLGGTSLLPISGGVGVPSTVCGVVKGVSGTAGQLKGEFDVSATAGKIRKNTQCGVFGHMKAFQGEAMETACAGQVRPGAAVIRADVEGDRVETYDIEILRCYDAESSGGRNMLIRITDPELLAITGGIVQGMSGSPIIQDGKLVGAVTHVLVNEPKMGYGIFIENMLDEAG